MQSIYQLEGKIQHYAWGGYAYIPSMLQLENNEQQPFAEYWLGAHPNHPSMLKDNEKKDWALHDFISKHPQVLSETTNYNGLPFLMKVLDVRQMLSIQVHPAKADAAAAFQAEEEAGIPMNAPQRNYKDTNHKPEMMVALSSFWLLHGFKSDTGIQDVLKMTPELNAMSEQVSPFTIKDLFNYIMTMPQEAVNKIVKQLSERIVPLYNDEQLPKETEDFWAARAIKTYCNDNQYDRGILAIYLLNLVHLQEGEGIFQPSGMPHAYLEGQNVEIMANSDNVLRAGLTDKHVDVEELLKHVVFEPTIPGILQPGPDNRYKAPAEEFALYKYDLNAGDNMMLRATDAMVLLVLSGKVTILAGDEEVELECGKSVFISAGTQFFLQTTAATKVFKATIGGM